jgi:S-ribosylhomocysteine lyase LuxS involved in autoinducer biosynthesis
MPEVDNTNVEIYFSLSGLQKGFYIIMISSKSFDEYHRIVKL